MSEVFICKAGCCARERAIEWAVRHNLIVGLRAGQPIISPKECFQGKIEKGCDTIIVIESEIRDGEGLGE